MAKVQRNVRFEEWIMEAMDEVAKDKKTTFSEMVNVFLEQQLSYIGLSKAKYDAKKYDIGKESSKTPKETAKKSTSA